MDFDFSLFLVVAVALCGIIWLADHFLWRPARQNEAGAMNDPAPETVKKEPILVEYAKAFFPVFLAVLILRSFIIEPFRIPSASMLPTLHVGDFILVNKFSYGVRLPVIGYKIIDSGQPERGDVAVFRYPRNPSINYIKRIIGLPGDRIGYFDKLVYINGQPMEQSIVSDEGDDSYSVYGFSKRAEQLGDISHMILRQGDKATVSGEYIVPEGHYFVMGDNRDNSNDSRYWGTVPEANLVGKAFFIWMNWDSREGTVKWQRIGMAVE